MCRPWTRPTASDFPPVWSAGSGSDRSSAGHLAPCSVVEPGRGATSTPARSIRWRRRSGPTRENRDALRDDAIRWGRCASGVDAKNGDAELARLVDEVLGDPCAGEGDEARRQQLEQLVVAPEGSCAAVGVPVGPEHHLMDRIVLGPAGGDGPALRRACLVGENPGASSRKAVRGTERFGLVGIVGDGDAGQIGDDHVRLPVTVLTRHRCGSGPRRRRRGWRGRSRRRDSGFDGIGTAERPRSSPRRSPAGRGSRGLAAREDGHGPGGGAGGDVAVAGLGMSPGLASGACNTRGLSRSWVYCGHIGLIRAFRGGDRGVD